MILAPRTPLSRPSSAALVFDSASASAHTTRLAARDITGARSAGRVHTGPESAATWLVSPSSNIDWARRARRCNRSFLHEIKGQYSVNRTPNYYPQQRHEPSRGLIVYECSPHSGSTLRRGRCGPQAAGGCAHVHLSMCMCVVRLPTVPLWAKGGPPSAEPAYCSPVRPPQQAHPRRRGHRAARRSSRESEAHAAERAAGPAAAPRRSSRMRS